MSLLALAGLAVFSLFAVGGSLQPTAPPGPTMKTLDEVEPRIPISQADIPLTISTHGSYYLTEDVTAAGTAITVSVDDVTIDLGGFALIGPESGINSGIYMNSRSNVEIRNGTVREFRFGIYEVSSSGQDHRVIDVRAMSNTYHGIYLNGYGNLVKDCTASDNGDSAAGIVYGIYADNSCTVTGNTASNNGLSATGTVYGISAGTGSTVTGNTAYKNTGIGIYTSSGSTVTGNTAYENGSHGIYAGTGCTIIGNTARVNTGNGIDFDGLGTVADNTVDRNSGYGIRVNSGAVVARNSCDENTLDGINAGDGNRIVGNNCVGNGYGGDGAGIHVQSQRNVIMDNTVLQNDRGIDVDAANNLIVKNSASTNGTEYSIIGGNKVGATSADPTTAGPWDNFDF